MGLKAFIKAFEKKQAQTNALDIGSFLTLPVQRLPRYMLLLQELEKYTDDRHPDKKSLIQANESIKYVLETIDNSKANTNDNSQKITTIQRNLIVPEDTSFDLVHPKRRYIREGNIRLNDSDANPYTFLFNDTILHVELLSKEKQAENAELAADNSEIFSDPREFRYVAAIPLAFCEEVRPSATDPFAFEMLLEEEVMTFYCASQAERDDWFQDVQSQHSLGLLLDFQ